MPEKSHWPFGEDVEHGHDFEHSRKIESEKARRANQAAFRQRMRNDRLIVGGRAHSKKAGLS